MTAVEWLVDQLFSDNAIFGVSKELLQQALEMEKQQHELTWEKSGNGSYQNISFEKYYSETYKPSA